MGLHDFILQIISFKTFSNAWYWLVMAVTWSVVSHWILGVPFDMIFRAKRQGGIYLEDVEALVAINIRRIMTLTEVAGLWILGFMTFVISSLSMCGFFYGFEFAQGMLFIGVSFALVGMIILFHARAFAEDMPQGQALVSALLRLRFIIQVIAMITIFLTATYGMYFNLSRPVGF